MDPETKKAAEFCRVAGVGHVVASKPPLKPLVRYRTEDNWPANQLQPVVTSLGLGWTNDAGSGWYIANVGQLHEVTPEWWAYLPEGDE